MTKLRQQEWRVISTIIAALWLAFLWYPIQLLNEASLPNWAFVAGIGGLVAFGMLYVAGFYWPVEHGRLGKPRIAIGFASILVLTVNLALLSGPFALAMTPFLVAYSGFLLWGRWQVWVTAALTVILLSLIWVTLDTSSAGSLTLATVLVVIMVILISWIQARTAETERVRRETLAMKERDKMATDVHDLIGHSLTLVALKAQLAERLLDVDPARTRAELAEIRAITAEALAGVRQTVSESRIRSLRAELAAVTSAFEAANIELQVEGDQLLVPTAYRGAAAWIVRESATNILRHSQASLCLVSLGRDGLSVGDNGIGAAVPEGNGIAGMRRRARAVGAQLSTRKSSLGGLEVRLSW